REAFGNDGFHYLRFTIHYLLVPSAADCRQNRNLAVLRQRSIEQLLAPHVVVVKENVYVLPQLSLFVEHAIAQANVPAPQTFKRFTYGCSRSVNDDLALSICKVSQESGDVESNHELLPRLND